MIELFNKTTIKVIRLLDGGPTHLRDISARLETSPGYISKILDTLNKQGITEETKERNKKIIRLNDGNVLFRRIKAIINIENILTKKGFRRLNKDHNLGIYGSIADGTNDEYSDIDMWIYGVKIDSSIQPIIRELENELKRKINLLILNKKRLESIKDNDYEFYLRLKLGSFSTKGGIFD